MQVAMRRMSSSTRHASAGGSVTSRVLSNSIVSQCKRITVRLRHESPFSLPSSHAFLPRGERDLEPPLSARERGGGEGWQGPDEGRRSGYNPPRDRLAAAVDQGAFVGPVDPRL